MLFLSKDFLDFYSIRRKSKNSNAYTNTIIMLVIGLPYVNVRKAFYNYDTETQYLSSQLNHNQQYHITMIFTKNSEAMF